MITIRILIVDPGHPDYQEWDDCSDIQDTEGYYDLFPSEGEDDSVTSSCASALAVNEAVINAEGSSGNWVTPKGYGGLEFICDPCAGEVLNQTCRYRNREIRCACRIDPDRESSPECVRFVLSHGGWGPKSCPRALLEYYQPLV